MILTICINLLSGIQPVYDSKIKVVLTNPIKIFYDQICFLECFHIIF